jgi:hypothetical protein
MSLSLGLGSGGAPGGTPAIAVVSVGGLSEYVLTVPAGYRHIGVRGTGAGAASATSIDILAQFNADTGSNYDWRTLVTSAAATAGSTGTTPASNMRIGSLPAATGMTNDSGQFEGVFASYADTTKNKSFMGTSIFRTADANLASAFCLVNAGWWTNVAAITSIRVFTSSGNWATGSLLEFYGLQ